MLTDSFFHTQTDTHSYTRTLLLIGRAPATPFTLKKCRSSTAEYRTVIGSMFLFVVPEIFH